MNLIFGHLKRSVKIAKNAKSKILGKIPPIKNIFFEEKKIPLSFYTT